MFRSLLKFVVVLAIIAGLVEGLSERLKRDKYLETVAREHRYGVLEAFTCYMDKLNKKCQSDEQCDHPDFTIHEIFKNIVEGPVTNVYSFFTLLLFDHRYPELKECLDASPDKYLVAMSNLIQRLNDAIGNEVKLEGEEPLNVFQGWQANCTNLPPFKQLCSTRITSNMLSSDLAAASYIADVINPGTACRLGLEGKLDEKIFEAGASQDFQATIGCSQDYASYMEVMQSFYP